MMALPLTEALARRVSVSAGGLDHVLNWNLLGLHLDLLPAAIREVEAEIAAGGTKVPEDQPRPWPPGILAAIWTIELVLPRLESAYPNARVALSLLERRHTRDNGGVRHPLHALHLQLTQLATDVEKAIRILQTGTSEGSR